jgi:uncharacterized iron-regulated protein
MLKSFSSPRLRLAAALAMLAALGGCGLLQAPTAQTDQIKTDAEGRLAEWLPADVLLLGEQHDAPEHQTRQRQLVAALAARGQLAALAMEMADSGGSTAGLAANASEAQARSALGWQAQAWPWEAYGPVVMAAVRAGVPVLGANLPRTQMRDSMADAQLDQRLPGPALKAQQQLIRQGHCDLLPESQIRPMTRIQIARDVRMAQTVAQAARAGQVVVLVSGSVHADKQLGVPQHLPQTLRVKAIRLKAGPADADSKGESFDSVWLSPALPDTDHCAGLKERLGPAKAKQ